MWDPVIEAVKTDNWNYAYYLTWSLYNYTPEPGGTYRIQVELYGNLIYELTYEFPVSYPLPIMSLVSDEEEIGKKCKGKVGKKCKGKIGKKGCGELDLDLEELSDGSLVLRWPAPAETNVDTSARVFVYLERDPDVGECDRLISFKAPTHMGMFIMPYEALVQALTNKPYYNGYFDFQLQLRVNDNSERSYSNFQRYYPK